MKPLGRSCASSFLAGPVETPLEVARRRPPAGLRTAFPVQGIGGGMGSPMGGGMMGSPMGGGMMGSP